MTESASALTEITPPLPDQLPEDPAAFLHSLPGPCYMLLPGQDRRRTRAVVTLIHGNEPSGCYAVHRWLQSGQQPAVDTLVILPSVAAAKRPPVFSTRSLPGTRDLNRCFADTDASDEIGILAAEILQLLHRHRPEAIVDIHNTSGSGPGFGVVVHSDAAHAQLVSLFASRMVVTDLRLGALMEISDDECPTVTVECGGRQDDAAHALAWRGLQRFLKQETLFQAPADAMAMQVYHNPIRLELRPGRSVTVASEGSTAFDVTLRDDAETLNQEIVDTAQPICWLNGELHELLQAKDHRGEDHLEVLFEQRGRTLFPRRPLQLFMFTNNPEIAHSDCIVYAAIPRP